MQHVGGHGRQDVLRHSGGAADAQRTDGRIVQRIELLMDLGGFLQHAAAALIVDFTGFGQADTARAAVKQLHL
ncbi:hypothetical protein D3C75_1297160 [compost metagenome]